MPCPGLPPGKRRRSGRARTLTDKAQQHEQEEEAATYREDEEGDESDAMEGVLMMTGDPVESVTDGNEYAADSPATANIEMTGTEPLAQRPAISKDSHNATTRNVDGKRPGNAVKILTDLVRSLVKETKDQRKEQEFKMEGLMTEIESLQARVIKLTDTIKNGSSILYGPSPATSYANVAASPPTSQPSNIRTLTSTGSAGARWTDTPYCTIDISRAREEGPDGTGPGLVRQTIETEMRTREGHNHWRCAAVIRDAKNAKRIEIACRDENELMWVKESAQRALPFECRVLRDQLFPVKVDNTNRTAVLNQEGHLLSGIVEALTGENEVNIAKISWLSKKDTSNAYGSMVVYVTKRAEAEKLLNEQYFHVAGESAYTRMFEPHPNIHQCYNCQAIDWQLDASVVALESDILPCQCLHKLLCLSPSVSRWCQESKWETQDR